MKSTSLMKSWEIVYLWWCKANETIYTFALYYFPILTMFWKWVLMSVGRNIKSVDFYLFVSWQWHVKNEKVVSVLQYAQLFRMQ